MYILNNFLRSEGDNISSNVIFHKTLGWRIARLFAEEFKDSLESFDGLGFSAGHLSRFKNRYPWPLCVVSTRLDVALSRCRYIDKFDEHDGRNGKKMEQILKLARGCWKHDFSASRFDNEYLEMLFIILRYNVC